MRIAPKQIDTDVLDRTVVRAALVLYVNGRQRRLAQLADTKRRVSETERVRLAREQAEANLARAEDLIERFKD